MTARRLVVAALAAFVGCSGSAGAPSSRGPTAEACAASDQHAAEASTAPVDLIGLDRAGIDEALGRRERDYRALSSVDPAGRKTYTAIGDLVGRARPLVAERWGERDGAALHERAYRDGWFDVVAQALDESGHHDDAKEWVRLATNGGWFIFGLAARCHHSAPIPVGTLSELPVGQRPPLPLLAVDTSVGGRLTRVNVDAAKSVGPKGLRIHFPMLSPDRKTIVAQTVTGPGQNQQVRTVSPLAGTVEREFGPRECGGWLPEGTLVLARRDGVHPAFSPDGRWIAYTVVPTSGAGGFDNRLGFAHPDGTNPFHLPKGRLSFPMWP